MTASALAHIVGGGPVWPLWVTGTLLFGGAVAVVSVARGEHTLRVELVNSAHRQYAPPVLTDETVTVAGYGAPAAPPPDCPTAPASTP